MLTTTTLFRAFTQKKPIKKTKNKPKVQKYIWVLVLLPPGLFVFWLSFPLHFLGSEAHSCVVLASWGPCLLNFCWPVLSYGRKKHRKSGGPWNLQGKSILLLLERDSKSFSPQPHNEHVLLTVLICAGTRSSTPLLPRCNHVESNWSTAAAA